MKLAVCIICDIVILLMVIYSLRVMVRYAKENMAKEGKAVDSGRLLAAGVKVLRYFTVLSNLFAGIAALVFLISAAGGGWTITLAVAKMKFLALACLSLTFLVVMVFLAPHYGYKAMIEGPNLWFHLLTPVAAAAEYLFADSFDGYPALPFSATFLAIVPVVLYGLYYLINMLLGGKEDGKYVKDWYMFAKWGLSKVPIVFAVILSATWILAFLLRAGNLALR